MLSYFGYAADCKTRVRFSAGQDFYLRRNMQPGCVINSASSPMGTAVTFLVTKRPELEDTESLQRSIDVKNAWSFTSSPPYVFLAYSLIKHQGQLSSYLSSALCFNNIIHIASYNMNST
jgi:hypothetical protein